MDAIIAKLNSNPLLFIILIALGIMLLISVIKRVWRMLVTIIIIILIYFGYLYMTGQKIPTSREEIREHVKEKSEELKNKGKEFLEKSKDDIVEGTKKEIIEEGKKQMKKMDQ
ncbi:MAG: YtxH domain-containing protein [Candidatus Cloacimonetes bacterium]|nr:YtxH domain-containing protein [Candidatus Cloacimonadota bacterium]